MKKYFSLPCKSREGKRGEVTSIIFGFFLFFAFVLLSEIYYIFLSNADNIKLVKLRDCRKLLNFKIIVRKLAK